MAWVHLTSPYLEHYMTDLQLDILGTLKDPSVRENVNQIIANMCYDYVPLNSGIPSRVPGTLEQVEPGALRKSVKVTADGITWRTAYANYVWVGMGYGPHIPIHAKGDPKGTPIGFYSTKEQHPVGPMSYSTTGTGKRWFNLMLAQKRRSMSAKITHYLKRELKR